MSILNYHFLRGFVTTFFKMCKKLGKTRKFKNVQKNVQKP
jgi:hypothetical protein